MEHETETEYKLVVMTTAGTPWHQNFKWIASEFELDALQIATEEWLVRGKGPNLVLFCESHSIPYGSLEVA